MEIGAKLRQARQQRGLTQEELAERLGLSRQTISNWENQRSFPDIVSLIAISELYGLSLDELVKEDRNMIDHLRESTDTVGQRQQLSRLILLAGYLAIWTLCLLSFWVPRWLGGHPDAMGYALLVFYLILPAVTLALSVWVGRDRAWRETRWLMLLFFGVMYMLAPYATFSLANTLHTGNRHLPELGAMLPGILCAALGMGAGALLRRRAERRVEGDGGFAPGRPTFPPREK